MTDNSNDSSVSAVRFLASEVCSKVSRILPRCSVCHESYSFPGPNSRYNQHLPVLLSCGHIICENCLWQSKSRHFVKCPSCDILIPLNLKRRTSEQFEYNFYVFGLIKHITTYGNDVPIQASHSSVPKCGECFNPVADRKCLQCDSLYCYECFKKVHHFSNVLRTHQTVELASPVKFTHTPAHCENHPENHLNFYCETCERAICLECKTQSHLIHSVNQLYQRNVDTQREVPSYIALLNQLRQLNKMSIETCNSTLQTEKTFAQDTIDEISNYFIDLHGHLQLLESQLVKKVIDRFKENLKIIQKAQETLKSNKDQIECNLEKLNYYNRNTPYNLDLESLLKEINSFAKELPCDLNVFQLSQNPFTFEKPLNPLNLASQFVLKWADPIQVMLKPCHNISSPPHYQPSTSNRGAVPKSYTPPHSDLRQKPQRERLPGKKSQPEIEPSCSTRESSNFLDQSVDMGQPKEKKHRKHSSSHKKSSRDSSAERRSQKAVLSPRVKLLPKIESESVRVSHIKSPHEIYIQNLTFVTSVEHFVDMCSDVAQQQVKTEDILTGEMYLLKDIIGDNEKWYRAELKTYNSAESLYEMRLVDFGNVRKVTKSRVRTCPEILKKQPRGAIQCSLYNLHPRKGKWTDEVNCLLSELVQSDTITKMTLGTDGDVHLVDLIVMKNLTPISIRDTLIKVNLAKSISTTDHGMNQLIFELNKFINAAHSASPKFYAQTVTAGGYFAPKVIHIESLVEFYVMKALDIPMYENQGRAMDQHYENPKNMMDRVYSPEIGMPVALNYNDHWHRGEVIGIMGPLQVQVQLVDIGTKHTVSLRSLRILHSDFMKLSKGTIACALVHIAPTEHHNFQWPPEALETFRALTSTNNLELFVHSHHPSNNNFFNVTLYSVRKDKNISINAQLVQLEFATSTGSESIQVEFQKDIDDSDDDKGNLTGGSSSKNKKKRSFRISSKIVNVVTPGEFYVIFLHHIGAIEHIQRKIQGHMANYVPPDQFPIWNVNDLCFVHTETPDDQICEWRRAVVRRRDESSDKYEVYLMDFGVQVQTKSSAMAPLVDKTLQTAPYGALRCHLSHIEPTAGSKVWASSAVDKLRSYCTTKKFEGYAVTMMGPWVNNSTPVVLWGRTEEDDPLQPTIVRWKNINESMVHRGYAHLTEKFPSTFDNDEVEIQLMLRNQEFEEFIGRLNECGEQSRAIEKDPLEDKLTSEITMVTEWKSAEPWTEVIFMGVTTCVDNNGIIYMYNVKRRELLDEMREIALNVLSETLPSPVEQFWAKNQPCMAKYQLDNKFYRGIVRRVDKDKSQCLVQFVDYGNIEECAFKDMRKNLLFGDIPILSYRFKFGTIVPFKRDEPWPCDVLDKIHAYTVGHECTATLTGPPEIIHSNNRVYDIISLRMGSLDLVDYLLENEMAVRAQKEDTIVERTQLECIQPDDAKKAKKGTAEKQKEKPTLDTISKFQDYFKRHDLTLVSDNDEATGGNDESDNSDYFVTSSDSDCTAMEEDLVETIKKKSLGPESSEEFNPTYTSTKVPDTEEIFMQLVLEEDCEEFEGMTTEVVSPTDLWFYPEIEAHINEQQRLDKCLQEYSSLYPCVSSLTPGSPYLVRYDEDGRWYRALVDSDRTVEDEILVKFVDYLNTEMVSLRHIKNLHPSLQVAPLRNIQLRLADVRVNPRYRAEDVERELRKLLHQKKVYVKILEKGPPHLVQIFAGKDAKEVIYEPLIANKFYIRESNK
ncbi:uncharacterized protein LOC129799737 [Phlebotomus papatasi]|uniref:uncharacterized protein LOC129799737 n=1 Tax=Phlebotomus papatasi TaxID=29031 RepID=UPI0024834D4A|nr:uncharacterized protein LOC129799737 [Phlebotomus papatasi]XP_055699884.1 uncharacterized protein LOC129799737 [Phlebotomus papatasi]